MAKRTTGCGKSLVTITYDLEPRRAGRKLPSDALAVHQIDQNLVYAGLRNAQVVLADMRTPDANPNYICRSTKSKAVVGVRRLADSTVPFGVVASAMGDEVCRFSRIPSFPSGSCVMRDRRLPKRTRQLE